MPLADALKLVGEAEIVECENRRLGEYYEKRVIRQCERDGRVVLTVSDFKTDVRPQE